MALVFLHKDGVLIKEIDRGEGQNIVIADGKKVGDKLTKADLKKARNAYIRKKRSAYYQKECNGLKIAVEQGEAKQKDLDDKIAEIKERFPEEK